MFQPWIVWDVGTQRQDFTIGRSKHLTRQFPKLRGDSAHSSIGGGKLAYAQHEANVIDVCSLSDGQVLSTVTTPFNPHEIHLTADGRFLLYSYYDTGVFRTELRRRWTVLDNCLRFFDRPGPSRWCLGLVDFESRKEHLGIRIPSPQLRLGEDGKSFFGITDEGECEYDLPPRYRAFSPWAWAVLAGWLVSCVAWWKYCPNFVDRA